MSGLCILGFTLAEIQLCVLQVALIEEIDGDYTGHSDGVVSFVDDYTLAYSVFDNETFKKGTRTPVRPIIVEQLKNEFGDRVKFLPLP